MNDKLLEKATQKIGSLDEKHPRKPLWIFEEKSSMI